ncbi:MAG: NapC/NirT family cytochrome c [Candidatus Brocadiales bacterium]
MVRARISITEIGGMNLRLLLLVILASLGVVAAIGATVAYYPQRPEYCARCHSMRPAYDRWARTVCRDVSCVECHTGGKGVVCLSQEIEDSNCMSGRCHTREKLFAKKEPYKKTLPFSHETHLKEDPPGLSLRCTACHSYQGGEKHFDIDEKTCNLCHFILRNEGAKLADGGEQELGKCTLCHKDVEKKLQIYDKEFDHANYELLVLGKAEEKAGVECVDCHHNETIHGPGSVERRQCYYCHDKVPDDYSSAKEMHYDHMARHKVGCNPCHQEIIHKIYKEDKELEGCESCKNLASGRRADKPAHRRSVNVTKPISLDISRLTLADTGLVTVGHNQETPFIQRQMMKGEGGRGINGSPDPMFLATVSCTGCHKSPVNREENNTGEGIEPCGGVDPGVCNYCHEKNFEKIYKEQKGLVSSQLEVLKGLLEATGGKGRAEGVEVMEARHNYEFIASDGSFGIHNIKYTKELLELSIRQLKEVLGS